MPNPLDLQKISEDLQFKNTWASYFTAGYPSPEYCELRVFYRIGQGHAAKNGALALVLTFKDEQISVIITSNKSNKTYKAVFENSDDVWKDIDALVQSSLLTFN